ncbi:MAG TPA: alpha/beta fold hydrolase [Polyangiaceae bacterium]
MARVERLPPPPAHPVRSPPVTVRGETEALVAGRLDARVHLPASPRRLVVLCHPHPLYGGSMHSPVPLAIAKTLADVASDVVGWARFDFRGVGKSSGAYDDGRGEVDDARAVIDHLRGLAPGVPVSVCGHSFGSWVGLRAAAADGAVDRVLLVAPSTRFFESWDDALAFAGPKTIFLGDHDEFCDVDEGRALAARLGAELRVFEGFDHHFTKSRRAVAEAAVPFVAPEV